MFRYTLSEIGHLKVYRNDTLLPECEVFPHIDVVCPANITGYLAHSPTDRADRADRAGPPAWGRFC